MQTTIQTLFKKGYSKAHISRELGDQSQNHPKDPEKSGSR